MEEGADQQTENNANWQFQTDTTSPSAVNYGGVPLNELPAVTWSASEYIAHQKSARWYVLLWSSTVLLALVIFLITHDILASIVMFVIGLAFSVFAARKPLTVEYSLDEEGIYIGEKFFPYAIFKSFAIVEEGAIDSIWLRPLKRFMQPLSIYYSPSDETSILQMLANFLPQELHEPDILERAARRLRF